MKYYDIVLLILCLHVSMATVNAFGVFHTNTNPDSEWFNKLYLGAGDKYNPGGVQSDGWFAELIQAIKGLAIFIVNFGIGIIVVPATLGALGLTSPYVGYISILIYALYLVGLFQVIADKPLKGMS